MKRFVLVLPLLAAALACNRPSAPDSATGAISQGERPPPPPDIQPIPAPDAATLSVVSARPQDVLAGLNRPTVTFSKPVFALSTLEQSDAQDAKGLRIEPKLAGSWHWLGSASVEFIPSAQAPYSTEFIVTVPRGLAALDGTKLAADYTFRFHTPLVEAQRYQVEPAEGQCRWSTPDQIFKVVLNQPLAAPQSAFFFEVQGGERVPAQVIASINVQDEREAKEAAETDPAKTRRFDRASGDTLKFKNQQTRYELKPQKPLPLATRFILALDIAAKAAQGPLPIQQEFRYSCQTYGPMKVSEARRCTWGNEHCTRGPSGLVFTNPVGAISELQKRVSFDPPVTFEWKDVTDEDSSMVRFDDNVGVSLPARLRPGTKYTLKVEAGVSDVFGQAAPAFQSSFMTDDLEPSVFVGTDHGLLEASGDGKVPAQVTNVSTFSAELWELTPEQYAQLRLCNDPSCRKGPTTPAQANIQDALTYPKNEPHLHPLDLRAVLKDGKKQGLVFARVAVPKPRQPATFLAQITDLVPHAKVGLTSGAVWVTSLSKGTPVPGAAVRVYDHKGAVRYETKSDADGLATLPGLDQLDPDRNRQAWEEPRVMVAASLEGDVGVATTHWSDQARGDNTNFEFDGLIQRPLGLFFSDRGLYRPGDTVHVKGILRRRDAASASGLLTMPEGTAIQLETKDPDGKVLDKRTLKLSRYGTLTFDLELPKESRLGSYDVLGVQPDGDPKGSWFGQFRVAEYRAPTFRVDLLTSAPQITAGESLSATVSARYLFGGAMTGAQASWSVVRTTTDFAPPLHDGFSFGKQTWSYDEDQPPQDSGFVASGKATIDKNGNATIDAGKLDAPAGRPTTVTIEAEVQDVSRQSQAGRAQVLVHPASFYVGLGKQSLFMEAGKTAKIPVVAVKPDGKRALGVSVKLAALSRAWHSVRKKGAGGVFQSVTEAVDTEVGSCEVKTAAEEQGCELKLEKAGYFTLQATAKDEQGRVALSTSGIYAIGPGFASWERGDTPKVELVADKQSYAVGDVAKVLIKSPYPESLALVSIEREGVNERHVQKLVGTATAIEVPITEAMVPNVYVGALLVRPRVEQGGTEPGDDPGRPSMRVGFAELKVGTEVKRLAVEVKPSKTEWQPRQKVPVALSVKDAAGKAVKAEITVYGVDEGVLRLAGYTVPDALAEMFPHRGLGVAIGEPLLSLVRRQKFGEKGELQPGGGGGREAGGGIRGKFLTTVLWKTLETDADGKASVEIELPDNLTTFRIMAVALTEQDRFGSGQSEVRVSLPLLVIPALPRFARTGDLFEAGVVVNAKGLSAERSEVSVSAEVSGAAALAEGQPAEQKVTVEEGVAREVRFKVKATGSGIATLQFRASAQGGKGETFKDAVEQKIPVQLPVELEAVATYGDTDKKATEGLVPPADVRPDVGSLTVTMSSTALGGLGDAMEQLLDYPYGCLEQLSSRLVPFVAVREVQRVFGLAAGKNEASAKQAQEMDRVLAELTGRAPGEAPIDADAVVKATLSKIEQLQLPSGGFRYWPGDSCASAWQSIYATMALQRASQLGYPVHKSVLDSAKKFVAQKAEGTATCPFEKVGNETRAFALQVLARMGDPRPAYYDELYAEKDKLPLFGKALLADAIAIGKGKLPRAQALLQDILDHAQETQGSVHFEEGKSGSYAPLLSSDTRTTGMVLQTLADVNPTHPFVGKIARYLTGVRKNGGYRNTQEAAYALMGLTEVVRAREKAAPDFVAKVTLAGKELFTQTFKGRSLAVTTQRLSMSDLSAKTAGLSGKAALPFEFEVNGTGFLTYGALMRYAPKELPTKARDEGLFVQRWLEAYDTPGRVATSFGAGELVRVRVRVATRMERNYVAIDVPLPAGLEAVDTGLATTATLPRERGEESQEEGGEEGYDAEGAGRYSFWSPIVWSEKRDDRVIYFSDTLPAGVHVQSFVARATTPGTFLLKPAKAEEMYTPEVFGRSEAGTVTVSAQKPISQK